MTFALALSPFTSPDLLPTGTDAVKTAETRTPDQEMEEIRAELYAALRNIQNLRHQYPYEATGYVGEPVYRDFSADARKVTIPGRELPVTATGSHPRGEAS